MLCARQLNCFVMFIWDLGPVTLVLSDEVHAEISGVLVADSRSLDGISMSRMLVSLLCAISGGWLKIFATSVRDCKTPTGLDDFAYTDSGRVVHKTDDWSPLGSCFVVGLKSFLTWNSSDFLQSGFDYVIGLSIETAISEIHKLLRTGRVSTSCT